MYSPNQARYGGSMLYRRCGRSGIQLPAISLGLWHNFGEIDPYGNMRALLREAFDLGITHFDLANNYGPPPGAAESHFGRLFKDDFAAYRDELIISTKAGYHMWDGPYGDWGSKKYLVASLDQSLSRMGLDYVDIFYHHRPDPNTPIEETMEALDLIVRQGKALYAGISNYGPGQTEQAVRALGQYGRTLLIHQVNYSLFNRHLENGLQTVLEQAGAGIIAYCPLAQGLLTERYLSGMPADSRAQKPAAFLREKDITQTRIKQALQLKEIAAGRGQSLAQMALAWVLREGRVTSSLIGASKVSQIRENVAALARLDFSADELDRIDTIVGGRGHE
jgi:L-glyceraldehyde 3-phosphate reductase